MKQSIQERMNRQINLATGYNTLFDLIVTTTETSLETASTSPADNQYNIITSAVEADVICNDNQYNTITVYIYDVENEHAQIGTLSISLNGDMDESLHNVPRSIRRIVNDYIDDIYDAIDSWIDEQNNSGNE